MRSCKAADVAKRLLAPLPQRLLHVTAVADSARSVATTLSLDCEILVSAAWLHDIGYSPEVAESGFHPLDGARYLRGTGWDGPVVQLVAHHSGAILEAEERGLRQQLLAEFPFESSPSMDALWYCDMTTSPDGHTVSVDERLAEIRARYGPANVVTRFVERAEPELVAAVRRVEERLAAAQSR